MVIVKDTVFIEQLKSILRYIAQDKRSAAINFERELNKKLLLLLETPYLYKPSHYFDDNRYRDLVYQGYTVIYKIDNDDILVLEIFKWIDK